MANPSDVVAAIQPGSTDYGDRGPLAAGIQATMGAGGGQPGVAGAGPGATGPTMSPSPGDPLGALLGEYMPEDFGNADDPLTQGLSYGPGSGPADVNAEPISDLQSKLMAVAQYAKTPHLRMQARMALRRLVRNKEVS